MGVPGEKVRVVPCAVDRDIFRPRKDEELIKKRYHIESEYLLYLGTLEPRKNIKSIILAFRVVAEKNKNLKLVIADGKGWM